MLPGRGVEGGLRARRRPFHEVVEPRAARGVARVDGDRLVDGRERAREIDRRAESLRRHQRPQLMAARVSGVGERLREVPSLGVVASVVRGERALLIALEAAAGKQAGRDTERSPGSPQAGAPPQPAGAAPPRSKSSASSSAVNRKPSAANAARAPCRRSTTVTT